MQPAIPRHWTSHLQALAKGKQRDLQRSVPSSLQLYLACCDCDTAPYTKRMLQVISIDHGPSAEL